ncbi:MAG: nicotinamide-nucleotide amidohydrolase family protein [Eubacterium sp.]|jgi:nicotinamide-nucleotide amidase|nr:nicotinamide-nucleotide amidohydrolase family protein [Eubacterium sp.]
MDMDKDFYNIVSEVDKRAQNVVKLLKEYSLVVSTAESCSGGLLAAALTGVAGASEVFNFGACTYSNGAKEKYLNVKNQTLKDFGAVSKETSLEMARGACAAGNAGLGLAITGIAGPGGGTAEKPVGTVYIAAACGAKTECKRLSVSTDRILPELERQYIRYYSVNETLKLAEVFLAENDLNCFAH